MVSRKPTIDQEMRNSAGQGARCYILLDLPVVFLLSSFFGTGRIEERNHLCSDPVASCPKDIVVQILFYM